jgi:hypothetical protein
MQMETESYRLLHTENCKHRKVRNVMVNLFPRELQESSVLLALSYLHRPRVELHLGNLWRTCT